MLSGRVAVQPVLSGSMTGYAGRGDLVVGWTPTPAPCGRRRHPVRAAGALRDPRQSPGGAPDRLVDTVDGRLVATTKGDANPQPDPWTLDLAAHPDRAGPHRALPSAGWPFIRLHLLASPAGRMAAGLTLMAAGGVLLMLGRRRLRRSDEPWPPAFEGEALEARLRLVQQRHAAEPPAPAASRFIPRQRQWTTADVLAHFPFD